MYDVVRMKLHDCTTSELFQILKTSPHGLTSSEASQRLQESGPNEIENARVHWTHILVRQFKSPFIYLLLVACVLSLFLGQWIDSLMVFLFLGINTTLGFYQEYHSEKTVQLLKKYLEIKSTVIRDGKEVELDVEQLVPGDMVRLVAGDRIPADVRFIESADLLVDESVLTGESVPREKTTVILAQKPDDIYSASNIGFLATTVVSGEAKAVVIGTGKNTAYGEVAKLTAQTERMSTFERQLSQFSKFTLIIVLATLALLIIANLAIKRSPNFVELTLFSIALAVSIIPEALPVVTTFSLSLGAAHLTRKHVVVKRLSAVEDLGSIEVLCSDKTGTLTENKLVVDEINSKDQKLTALYASIVAKPSHRGSDPFYEALVQQLSPDQLIQVRSSVILREFPFDPNRKRASKVVKISDKKLLLVVGALEMMVPLCKSSQHTDPALVSWVKQKGASGKRVVALAVKELDSKFTNVTEDHLQFLGAISFVDPIKSTTIAAVHQAKQLGLQIKILTGDSKEVAGYVAAQIHLIESPHAVITGSEFEALPTEKQHAAVEHIHVFARVIPQQKYKIIQLLQEKHEVGFLGEGINDAPALKIANVALVVRGAADIAREAADIVLLQKSLKVIVDGVKEGRQVFTNTTKYITATLSANFGNFFAVSLASLLIDYLPMLPLQILLVNLLTDFPMIAVATDTVDHEAVATPSRFQLKNFILFSLVMGIVSTFFDFLFFGIFVRISAPVLQTAWFMGSVVTELGFLFSVRSRLAFWKASRPSNSILILSALIFGLVILLPYTVIGKQLFLFQSLPLAYLIVITILVTGYFLVSESAKLLYFRERRYDQPAFLSETKKS
ncbi:MAG: Cation-transporting P-type ATPase [Candidatus Gottesmanbacteria bacterium GW2011_GWA1_43_11]|uniref:Cation-transporting P-type ATPase n=1 Tax=Candidatus Gottesmanbacteria bacterium GW2011_GWA1_43_11 TaxID=1618436 RepID=A0A0G1CJV4_9BACT|nr:MAG: Cation-transporting P-type ATPase [Candidatus Gottesmanbacteria bacterium GW2011_GWA1_43_11]